MGSPTLAALCALLLALALAGPAAAFSRADLALPMDDGVSLAATLYLPDGPVPEGGWPAIVMFHGLGGNRTSSNTIAENTFANQGYAVLTFDTRGHGQSGGLFSAVGERELQDFRAIHAWLAARKIAPADLGVGDVGIELRPFLTGLNEPLFVTHAGDGTGDLYIVEKAGTIRLARNAILVHSGPR